MKALLKTTKNSVNGVTLIEVIVGMAILVLLSSLILSVSYTAKIAVNQAGTETMEANLAFAVLDNIRAKAPALDLNSSIEFSKLNLSNPNNMKVTISLWQDAALPDIYSVTVRVEDNYGRCRPVILNTLISKSGQ